MKRAASFAVIIPMYNEQAGAEQCIREGTAQLLRMPEKAQLIVVNDGSKDQTPGILNQLASEIPHLTVVHHPTNRGYGSALRTGVTTAADGGFEYCVFMDSDLTNDPADLPKFAAEMSHGT